MSKSVTTTEQLVAIYKDPEQCADLVGLTYNSSSSTGLTRKRAGKGFTFIDVDTKKIEDAKLKKRIKDLVIPPAWQDVWISPNEKSHVLATGTDERGRKQYIYHPKWRITRDLLKFYKTIVFAKQLPAIRKKINQHMDTPELSYDKVIATMLWILDNTYIRIGNDIYFTENESVGLTTLATDNIVIAGPVVTFAFKAKSGKQQQFSLENKHIVKTLKELIALKGERLFQYKDDSGAIKPVDANNLNAYLADISTVPVTAKEFRTWGGTLMAFNHLVENQDSSKKNEKLVVEAIDSAANILGNTRSVARSSYVHPHILSTYGSKNFDHYYTQAQKTRKVQHLDKRESELLTFLELLFEEEFDLLKSQ